MVNGRTAGHQAVRGIEESNGLVNRYDLFFAPLKTKIQLSMMLRSLGGRGDPVRAARRGIDPLWDLILIV
jgi:hypothetical protein